MAIINHDDKRIVKDEDDEVDDEDDEVDDADDEVDDADGEVDDEGDEVDDANGDLFSNSRESWAHCIPHLQPICNHRPIVFKSVFTTLSSQRSHRK